MQPGEEYQQSNCILDVIEEERDEGGDGDDDDVCSDDSESGEEEFTPSKWNRDLTPSHSLLKSPQNKSVSVEPHLYLTRIGDRVYIHI